MSGRIKLAQNFYEDEFTCNCGCGLKGIDPLLVNLLQETRYEYGSSMVVTSGMRCPDWNKEVGGSEGSSHLWGMAADIEMTDPTLRWRMIRMMQKFFKRVGIAKSFIHVDVDYKKANPIIWVY